MEIFIDKEIVCICELVGFKVCVIGVIFGGVDSFVVVKLMYEVLGDWFYVVMVDNGVLCGGEVK